jgi:hypothetical protein
MLPAELGVEIPVADLFDHPSVAAMARHLNRRGAAPDIPGAADRPGDRAARRAAGMRRRRRARARSDGGPELEETE